MSEIKRYKILVVDDNADDRDHVKIAFGRLYDFYFAKDEESMRRILQSDYAIDLVLLDLVLDEPSGEKVGLTLIPEIQQRRPNVPIIIMTNDTDARNARIAMRAGAVDFLIKGDYERNEWNESFLKALKQRDTVKENTKLKTEVRRLREKEEQEHTFVGGSPKIEAIKRTLRIVSEEPNVTVLILGETGTGKEVAARFLHKNGARHDKPFIAVNLSAIQESLLESTLFGSVKGAYTGSTRDVEGYFRQANEGILMLDEIGDISADIQIKLLRFLENRIIRPVGSDKDVSLDVQIVAATHQNLYKAVQAGSFRADLYQRLKALTVDLPPLRERREDIFPILQHYLGDKLQYTALIDEEAQRKLFDYEWVGNVRELRNTANHMLLQLKIQQKSRIDVDCLPVEVREYVWKPAVVSKEGTNGTSEESGMDLDQLNAEEKREFFRLQQIEEALRVKNKVKADAAEILNFKSADSLLYAIRTSKKRFPGLFEQVDFPYIKASYPQFF